ncbi:hypothetical protein [Streptomyces nanshensis]|uniref:hypothetical protein n=1 Tax=Streptomyces nanshensis TaxID=518642 RepID=UPI0030B8491D
MFRIETRADERRRHLVHQRLRENNSRTSPAMRRLRGTAADSEVPVEVYALDGERLLGGLVGNAWVGGTSQAGGRGGGCTSNCCGWTRSCAPPRHAGTRPQAAPQRDRATAWAPV